MDKQNVVGYTQVASGTYVGYQGLKHGLPRTFGLRMEYHTTSKENASLIKKAGNILDPKFGGRNGWSAAVKSDSYIKKSKNYIHITGIHPNNKIKNEIVDSISVKFSKVNKKIISNILRPIIRRTQNLMYRVVGNQPQKIVDIVDSSKPKVEKIKDFYKTLGKTLFKNNTKKFVIPGIDSYFAKEFIPDTDDIALKSSKPLKAYTNRFIAMVGGLKKFGLKGIKENKSRVGVGVAVTSLGLLGAYKLINKGLNNIKQK